jgi:formylglycine-generating enzyme required for sulfatase activity
MISILLLQNRKLLLILSFSFFCSVLHNIEIIAKEEVQEIEGKRQGLLSQDGIAQSSTNTALTYRWIDKRSKGNTEIASWQRVGVGGEAYLDLKKLRPYPVGSHTLILEVNDKQKEFKPEMVLVNGGCFQMGNIFDEGAKYEKPVHEVCVDDFYIGKYEVTQDEWEVVMGSNPSTFKGNLNCPVEHVSYHDVIDFINKLRLRTGKKYRLPTEAEWEFAARSGGKDELWAGISDVFELEDYAWYKDSSDGRTHPVGQKKPNKIGLYDMSGNVWEWIWDRFDTEYYETSPKDNPKGPLNGEHRVIRGGSWSNYPRYIRSVDRGWVNPDGIYVDGGFRLAISVH